MSGFRGMVSLITFTGIIALVLSPLVKSQDLGCSVQGLDLNPCLNQSTNSMDSCCKALNQAVQTGFYCLCSLLTSTNPLLSYLLSVSFSNCYISSPPLSHCRVLAPEPVAPPPDSLKDPAEPSASETGLTQGQIPPMAADQPGLGKTNTPKLSIFPSSNEMSHGGDRYKSLFDHRVLLIMAIYPIYFLFD